MSIHRIHALLQREDFRSNPMRALLRRAVWHLRWKLHPEDPWQMRAHGKFPLLTIRGGAGALIYYQGTTEPETAHFLKCFLKPGMVFVDVGAHLGEFTILAADLVRPSGFVHAFEPHPKVFSILLRNIRLNSCRNVSVSPHAVWYEEGISEFEMTVEPSTSALHGRATRVEVVDSVKVRTVTLDRYFARSNAAKPNLVKIDVEGAELHVLRGAKALLEQPADQAPTLIFEYGPSNTERFGYCAHELIISLREFGYRSFELCGRQLLPLERAPVLSAGRSTINLVAAKAPLSLSLG